ncbi:hypothetical protein, partial [Methylobacterium sp. J-068]|uniref:hypothetical protein n=1 Tax=Methylobacterium sp. J-068 TaxID=2836649 RepID=UPI001FBA6AF3
HLGRGSDYRQHAREVLQAPGWSVKAPRPKNPGAAIPEEQAASKKNSPTPAPRKKRAIPGARSRSSARTRTASG